MISIDENLEHAKNVINKKNLIIPIDKDIEIGTLAKILYFSNISFEELFFPYQELNENYLIDLKKYIEINGDFKRHELYWHFYTLSNWIPWIDKYEETRRGSIKVFFPDSTSQSIEDMGIASFGLTLEKTLQIMKYYSIPFKAIYNYGSCVNRGVTPNTWKYFRKNRGQTCKELANQFDVSRENFTLVENHLSNLSSHVLLKGLVKNNIDYYQVYDVDGLMQRNEDKALTIVLRRKSGRNKLKLLRMLHDEEVDYLAKFLGVSPQSYFNIESGNKISSFNLWKLIKKYRVPWDCLIDIRNYL